MTALDWGIVGGYLLSMLVLAAWTGRHQRSRQDYFLASRGLPSWALATSIIATQCSTNSLLGAPAFVGFAAAGGLLWLQYELAVPFAMLALCFLFGPVHRAGVISIYGYLEQRLGRSARSLASACFLFFRAIATGVTVYGVASIVVLLTGVSYLTAVFLLMALTILYDVLGGMRAVVISDVAQMVLLLLAVALALAWLTEPLVNTSFNLAPRLQTVSPHWGFNNDDYGFWPMLVGGFFLYAAYYGCDQSQAQRLLATGNPARLQRVLVLNGLARFPLVFAYCLLGLGLAAYAAEHPSFLQSLPPTAQGSPNINLVFPAFVLTEFTPGLVGLVMVGLFAAAMSSIDSALNSLSAVTLEDFLDPKQRLSEEGLLRMSRLLTLGWGLFTVLFSFAVEHIAGTVLEAINKVGSMANGPLLALFVLAVIAPHTKGKPAVMGFLLGLTGNGIIALTLPQLSWLWWNVTGFMLAFAGALLLAPSPLLRSSNVDFVKPSYGAVLTLALFGTGLTLGLYGWSLWQ